MRILLVRTSSLGDVVHCLPVLTALRRHDPEARIGWVIEEAFAPLLQGHPDLDDLLVVRLRAWRRRPFGATSIRQLAAFLGGLRRFAPDVVIDLMGNHKAGVIAALTLADRRIGATAAGRREPSSRIWINEPVEVDSTHATERALELLGPLGVPLEPPRYDGERLLPEAVAPADVSQGYLLVHPGAGWPNKRYPPELWGEVARRLHRLSGRPAVVVHGPGEESLARRAIAASDGVLRHLPTHQLTDLVAALRGAALVLGGDSGPVHLAHALGRRVLCLMGPTDPASLAPPIEGVALWRELPCSFCHRRFDEPKACLTTIPPAAVVERAAALLAA